MKNLLDQVIHGDCLEILNHLENDSVNMAYLDPPFLTNKNHSAIARNRQKKFSFTDIWSDFSDYVEYMKVRIKQIHRILKDTGSIFVHCDSNANFLLRTLLNDIFGYDQFRSEIIWTYRRWSNSAKGLLPAHQTIFFYSKTDRYKFNRVYGEYSETTNIDQILQLRAKDKDGISVYATDRDGNIIYGGEKKGVPLSDVWEIPFLNPKAKERTGYPTQKPVLLLERIIEISTDVGDVIIDPFCGSGTTLVAANLLGRRSIGIDISEEAVLLSQNRLKTPLKTESAVLKKGRNAYINVDKDALSLLNGLDFIPVQRNVGIDAFLKLKNTDLLIPVRVQRSTETVMDVADKLTRATRSKKILKAILIRTCQEDDLFYEAMLPRYIELIDSTSLSIQKRISQVIAEMVTEQKII